MDFMKEVHEQLNEELEDVVKYMEMAREAKREHRNNCMQILFGIAHEEMTHAKNLRWIIEHSGGNADGYEQKFNLAHEALKHF